MTPPSAAERWFLFHGLPSVLTPRARLRALWSRSAPALAGYAVLVMVASGIYLLTGAVEVNIDGDPTSAEWAVLVLVAASGPAAFVTGWLVSCLPSQRSRTTASSVAAVVAVGIQMIYGGIFDTLIAAPVVLGVVLVTASGLGSVLGWVLRLMMLQITTVGALVVRALPVVLLTVLVFFNQPVWDMASKVSRGRLWGAILFLGLMAVVFLVSSTVERARPVMRCPDGAHDSDDRLDGTPFADMSDPPQAYPLRPAERVNVYFLLAASQVARVLTVAVLTALIFLVLGLILVSPALLDRWTQGGPSDGTFLTMTLPVPQALIQVSMFLGALTFMYLSARAVGDDRSKFLDPLIDDLRMTLTARNRYRVSAADPTAARPASRRGGLDQAERRSSRDDPSHPEPRPSQ